MKCKNCGSSESEEAIFCKQCKSFIFNAEYYFKNHIRPNEYKHEKESAEIKTNQKENNYNSWIETPGEREITTKNEQLLKNKKPTTSDYTKKITTQKQQSRNLQQDNNLKNIKPLKTGRAEFNFDSAPSRIIGTNNPPYDDKKRLDFAQQEPATKKPEAVYDKTSKDSQKSHSHAPGNQKVLGIIGTLKAFGLIKGADRYSELYNHLIYAWKMKSGFAAAFLNEYNNSMSKLYEKGLHVHRSSIMSGNGEDLEIIFFSIRDATITSQAYLAYMNDLRKGRHVGTNIEKAIWAILITRKDLVSLRDRGFADYLAEEQKKIFPNLKQDVFNDPLS